MKARFSAPLLACLILAGTSAAYAASSHTALAAQAKVSATQARTLALKVVPGKVLNEELEPEAGGSGLRYTFDIKTASGVREVGIDANNGKLLENSAD